MTGLRGLVARSFAKTGGYAALAERYPAPEAPPGPVIRGASVMFARTVAYRFHTELGASPAGLWVHPRPRGLGEHPALLIPWEEIRRIEPTRLYWERAVRLTMGDPPVGEVTIAKRIWDELRAGDRLPASLR